MNLVAARVDAVEDFQWLEKGKRNLIRKSTRRTSRPLSTHKPSHKAGALSPLTIVVDGMKRRPRDRVTVHYEKGQAPTLLMRFSFLDIPSPSAFEESIRSRPQLECSVQASSASANLPSPKTRRKTIDDLSIEPWRTMSAQSFVSLTPIRGVTPQLRGLSLPPPAKVQDTYPSPWFEPKGSPTVSITPPTPPMSPVVDPPGSALSNVTVGWRTSSSTENSTTLSFVVPSPGDQAGHTDTNQSFLNLTRSDTDVTQLHRRSGPSTIHWRTSLQDDFGINRNVQQSYTDPHVLLSASPSPQMPHFTFQKNIGNPQRDHISRASLYSGVISNEPIRDSMGIDKEFMDGIAPQRPLEHGHRESVVTEKPSLARIKTVGKAPWRYTPVPTPVLDTRASIAVEQFQITSKDATVDETS